MSYAPRNTERVCRANSLGKNGTSAKARLYDFSHTVARRLQKFAQHLPLQTNKQPNKKLFFVLLRIHRGNKEGNQQERSFTLQKFDFSSNCEKKVTLAPTQFKGRTTTKPIGRFPGTNPTCIHAHHFPIPFYLQFYMHDCNNPPFSTFTYLFYTTFTYLISFTFLSFHHLVPSKHSCLIIPPAYRLPHFISFPILSFHYLVPSMLSFLIIPLARRLPQLNTFTFLCFHHLVPSMLSSLQFYLHTI